MKERFYDFWLWVTRHCRRCGVPLIRLETLAGPVWWVCPEHWKETSRKYDQ